MKAEEIKTSEDLERWFLTFSEERRQYVLRIMSSRIAMRVLPDWAKFSTQMLDLEPKAIAVFRCVLTSTVAAQSGDSSVHTSHGDYGRFAVSMGNGAAAAAAKAASSASAAIYDSSNSVIHDVAVAAIGNIAAAAADANALERGEDILHQRLWPDGKDPLANEWVASAKMRQSHPAWSVFTDLYENALHGRQQNWPMLTELAKKDKGFWISDDEEILDRIAAVIDDFGSATPLSQAFPFDFTFDRIAKLMRIVGIEDDHAHLRETKVVQSFLDDAEEAKDALQNFADFADEMKSGRNFSGVFVLAVRKLLDELSRIGDQKHLRARHLVRLARQLETFSKDEMYRADLGEPIAAILDDGLTQLRLVSRKHFGPVYAALAPLSDLKLDYVDQEEVLKLFDAKIAEIEALPRQGKIALDVEGEAILNDMVRELHEYRAAFSQANAIEFQKLIEARFAESAGSTGLAILRFWEKWAPFAGARADDAIKLHERVEGLRDIVEALNNVPPS